MNYQAAKDFILKKLETELSDHLYYHGIAHTLDVFSATQELSDLELISLSHTQLLLTAALFHDSGFTVSRQEHEKMSCQIARRHLPDFDYTEREIELICGMIMATKIPQSPTNFLEEILCDADLDYLGRSDFYEIGELLFLELQAFDVLHSREAWNALQVSFLRSHHYFTKTNLYRREPRKRKHLIELEMNLKG